MKRVMTYAVSMLAIGLSAPVCASVSAGGGAMASTHGNVLSSIASTLDGSGNAPAAVGSSSASDNGDGSMMGGNTGNEDSTPLGGQTSGNAGMGSGEAPMSAPHDNAPSSSDRSHTSGATPRGKRAALTWQSLIPGSIQQ